MKTKLSLDITNKICDNVYKIYGGITNVIIVVAKKVHIDNWKQEIDKWGINTDNVDIICYESLKNYKKRTFDVIILDECHHMSEVRREILSTMHINEILIGLSATISSELIEWFSYKYDTKLISTSLQEAIDNKVLPIPTIYLIPLYFDGEVTECIYKYVKKDTQVIQECNWYNRWNYLKHKIPVRIYCNKQQYLQDLNGNIEWLKKRSMRNEAIKNKWLRLCNDRLKWLSDKKEPYILSLLDHFKNHRTLTFCSTIEQTEKLGKNCIHSKNKESDEILEKFNNKKIKHITSCQMLNEGMNLIDCRIGIYANINSSERINKQKFGRLLRHKHPIIIIPYYANTREEEIVKEITEDYDKNLIKVVKDFKDIVL